MAGSPPKGLPTEPVFCLFGLLFASPVCGLADLAEEWADKDDDVVGQGRVLRYGWLGAQRPGSHSGAEGNFPAFECRAWNIA